MVPYLQYPGDYFQLVTLFLCSLLLFHQNVSVHSPPSPRSLRNTTNLLDTNIQNSVQAVLFMTLSLMIPHCSQNCVQHESVSGSLFYILTLSNVLGSSGDSDGKEFVLGAGDLGSIPGPGRSPGEGNGSPLQYSCLENSMDREPSRLQSMGSQRVRHD